MHRFRHSQPQLQQRQWISKGKTATSSSNNNNKVKVMMIIITVVLGMCCLSSLILVQTLSVLQQQQEEQQRIDVVIPPSTPEQRQEKTIVVPQKDTTTTTTKSIRMESSSSFALQTLPVWEGVFQSTLKSCLHKGCKTYMAEPTHERIALLGPPGTLMDSLLEFLQSHYLPKHNNNNIQLIRTSHIPPYGYGKTHGWTKLIRVVPTPLMLGVTNTLLTTTTTTSSTTTTREGIIINWEHLLQAHLQQQVRYHCRCNHLAAHTALLTLTTNDLILLSSKNNNHNNNDNDKARKQQQQHLQTKLASFFNSTTTTKTTIFDNENNHIIDWPDFETEIQQQMAEGSQWLESLVMKNNSNMPKQQQQQVYDYDRDYNNKNNIWNMLDHVLQEELQQTKNLTAWPCQSFWNTIGRNNNNNHDGSSGRNTASSDSVISKLAASLSPNCTAPYTQCWVARDLCEAKGDGPCRPDK